MYKPPRVLSQFVHTARKRRKRKLLGDYFDFPANIMAIGRLDEDSEGLLLLTTDGKVSHRVRDTAVEKEYYCQVDGQITPEAVDEMKSGVEISIQGGEYTTLPCDARILECLSADDDNLALPKDILKPVRKIRDARHGPTSWLCITITEGKFRQVRKMTAAVGFPTLRLVRVRIADISLFDGMKMGEVRKIDINI
jgi:23S rRNA pseudouridine2457 synthase